ncbi:MAG: Phenylalanine-tRNA ligase beta subunit [Candidatus Magasanikbacteria bacterium GW2011_GWA2_45_39]|uniref:Phenylalanine--tRNA ligase beta subunit n=1 Tax=Candidatus Magasanikbacteria bacterium GW2011_GWA2_45_39 TaxID=1619041 RepID=A0A0G1MHX4_9BACT|nr:MAG: Phenylalanine-tRNA ligase beta subunit [Candidatus Magasanikbacteria bacterium GW2011_GWA2_45_39]HBW74081.1 phenylalanine--tRNA ligase subunit beta [Candidatus Magasanikbacteria bacterium]
MLLSYSWLKELVRLPARVRVEDVAKRLSLSTVEVEGIRQEGADLENIVVGVIKKIEPHPNADRLSVTQVDTGGKSLLTIVCGGSNLRVGQRVAVACVGARVRWHGEGELVELAPATIRGVASEGMICASTEIGLGERFPLKNEKEILDISDISARAGTPLTEVLGLGQSAILEIDNKSLSNRPDLWGYTGIAREVSALFKAPLAFKVPPAIKKGKGITLHVSVQDTIACPRYTAVALKGVKVVPSPAWMQERLHASGVRPINAIVDVTNYVMLEIGQPMHAFDYDAIKDARGTVEIVVRPAKQGEEFTTLDGHKHTLHDKMLLIANKTRAVAIAGVMGGDLSAVADTTHTIILESANFNARSIRRTSNTLSLRTESSARFEKSLDPTQAEWGLCRAVELYKRLFPSAEIASIVADSYSKKAKSLVIALDEAVLQKKLGIKIPLKDARQILERLGFVVRVHGTRPHGQIRSKSLRITVPSFRMRDVNVPEDLTEEIVRIYGYEHIKAALPKTQMLAPAPAPLHTLARVLKTRMAYDNKFHEAVTYAFVRASALIALGLKPEKHLMLSRPLSEERPYVATTIAANLLEAVEKNQHGSGRVALFEVAPVFLPEYLKQGVDDGTGGRLPYQPLHFGCVYSDKNETHAFAYVRDSLESVFGAAGYDLKFKKAQEGARWWRAGAAVDIWCAEKKVGYCAVLGRHAQGLFGINHETVAAEIDLSLVAKTNLRVKSYHVPSPFPAVTRDVALVMDQSVQYADVQETLSHAHVLVKNVELFDSYHGEHVGAGKKSLAFHILYQSNERTLTAEEADATHKELIAKVVHTYKAQVR